MFRAVPHRSPFPFPLHRQTTTARPRTVHKAALHTLLHRDPQRPPPPRRHPPPLPILPPPQLRRTPRCTTEGRASPPGSPNTPTVSSSCARPATTGRAAPSHPSPPTPATRNRTGAAPDTHSSYTSAARRGRFHSRRDRGVEPGGGFWRWRNSARSSPAQTRPALESTPSPRPSAPGGEQVLLLLPTATAPFLLQRRRPVQREERDGARELDAGEGATALFEGKAILLNAPLTHKNAKCRSL